MEEQKKRQQARQQKITRLLIAIAIISACIVIAMLTFIVVRFYGTGFPGKTLWDWLQLLGILAIPVAAVVGAAWYNQVQQERDRRFSSGSKRP